jgi:hypothetical protein
MKSKSPEVAAFSKYLRNGISNSDIEDADV